MAMHSSEEFKPQEAKKKKKGVLISGCAQLGSASKLSNQNSAHTAPHLL
jgi:hypothetical protein